MKKPLIRAFCCAIISVILIFPVKAESRESNEKIIIVFRNDDISALSDVEHERRIIQIFERYRIPQTVGVIPKVAEDFHDAHCNMFHFLTENQEVVELLRKYYRKGLIEIALHGYTHKTNFLHPTRQSRDNQEVYSGPGKRKWLPYNPKNPEGYSELRSLSYKEQSEKITKGKQLLEKWFAVPVITFILPWNSHDEQTIKAASDAGIKLVSSKMKDNNPHILKSYPKPLFIEHTADLSKLKPAVDSGRQFVEENNELILIVILYHSWMLRTPEDFGHIEEILNNISQCEDITFMTLSEVANTFPHVLKEISLVKSEAESEVRKTSALFRFVGKNNPNNPKSRFYVFATDYYNKQRKEAIKLRQRFYAATITFAFILSIVYRWLIRARLIRKDFALCLVILGPLVSLLYLILSYFGLFGFEEGIGTIDNLILMFEGIVIISLILGYLSVSKTTCGNATCR